MRHERLLVPVDFSFASRQALRLALSVARRDGARVDVLHVIPPPSKLNLVARAYAGLQMPREPEGAREEAELHFGQMISALDTAGVDVERLIEPGEPAATVVRIATERQSDLIVMGTHGRSGVVGVVLGSVARDVISCSPCPVLAVRGNEARGLTT
jgi:nucleotide-binding universal stress UspA family protein